MSMNMEKILQDIEALPPAAQQEVLDFVASLKSRYESPKPAFGNTGERETPLESEPFVGMWRDRSDMADSVQWVRELRRREWRDRRV